jgi:hypothetical protein
VTRTIGYAAAIVCASASILGAQQQQAGPRAPAAATRRKARVFYMHQQARMDQKAVK